MGYATYYNNKILKTGKFNVGYKEACYSYFYNHIETYEELNIFVPIKGDDINDPLEFKLKDVKLYNQLMRDCGLTFDFMGKTNDIGLENKQKNFFYHYQINPKLNTDVQVKFLLNFIRYLFEESFPEIVKIVFQIHKELPDLLPINKFILAHYSGRYGGGHDIRGSKYIKLFTEDTYIRFCKKNIMSIYDNLETFLNPDNDNVEKLLKKGDIKEAYETYVRYNNTYRLYVYGSLRKDEYNFKSVQKQFGKESIRYIKTKTIGGYKLYDLGSYPGIIKSGTYGSKLTVDELHISKEVFEYIDAMEVGANYEQLRNATYNDEIMYLYKGDVTPKMLVENGDWSDYLKNKQKKIKMENKKLKVYHVQGWNDYSNWMPNVQIVDNVEECDLVIFEGGEDVTPSYYGENKHHTTGNNVKRDEEEKIVFDKALALGKHMWGTCRGSQFLCSMSGGILVQHQDNPLYIHPIETYDGKTLHITSTHHQAQFPFRLPKENYKIIGWTENMSPFHKGGDDEELNPKVECEIVYYPKTKCLGVQGHPEMMYPCKDNSSHETIEYLIGLLIKFINNEL